MNMKRFVFLGFLLSIGMLATAQSKARNFTLYGRIVGPDTLAKKVYLQYRGEQGWKMDSAVVKAGTFSFTGKIQEPTMARFMARKTPESVFLMPGTQRIRLNSDGKCFREIGRAHV